MLKKKILCVIPARSGSKGIKNKNIIKLGGQPLIAWPINAALKSRYLDMVLVSTDSLKISKIAKKYGAEVPFLRPKKLATDNARTVDVIKHAIKFLYKKLFFFDYVLCLEPTSPLTSTNDIDNAIKILTKNFNKADSVISVSYCSSQHPEYLFIKNNNNLLERYLDKKKYSRRQNLKNYYFIDGSLYLSKVKSLFSNNSFITKKTIPFIMPKYKSFEIDDKVDLLIYKSLIKKKECKIIF
jgi:N-acylneuraminate cytidylyltransferase/CMP-N,N'-diacetyllegionaminic acid synthase